ncbi:hypothetical protein D3C80_2178350 [compost metagenome]
MFANRQETALGYRENRRQGSQNQQPGCAISEQVQIILLGAVIGKGIKRSAYCEQDQRNASGDQ